MQAFVESSQSSGGTTQAPEGSSDAGVYPLPEVPLNFQVTGRSQLLEVPNVAIAVVEIPGKAKRRSTVIRILGGSEAASRGVACGDRGEPLILRLGCSSSSNSSSSSSRWGQIPACRQSAAGILVRRRIRKSGAVEFETVGRVIQRHVFTGLADFYFVPPPGHRGEEPFEAQVVAEAQRACSGNINNTQEPSYIPPPFFCKGQAPFPYKVEAPPAPIFATEAPPESPTEQQQQQHQQQDRQRLQQQRDQLLLQPEEQVDVEEQQQQKESVHELPSPTHASRSVSGTQPATADAEIESAAQTEEDEATAGGTAEAAQARLLAAPASARSAAETETNEEASTPSILEGDKITLGAAAKAAAARAAGTRGHRAPRFVPSLPAAAAAATATKAAETAEAAAATTGKLTEQVPQSLAAAPLDAVDPARSGRQDGEDAAAIAGAAAAAERGSAEAAAPSSSESARELASDAATFAKSSQAGPSTATGSNNSSSNKDDSTAFNAVGRIGDEQLPVAPPPAAARAFADRSLLLALEELLQKQPVWLRPSLDAHLPPTYTAWRKKPAYAKTCFLFADGPFRGCLCRLGYDPRKDPESRHYQTIDFRDPFFRSTNWKAAAAGGGPPPSSGQQQRGWLHKDTLKTLRALMSLKSRRMRSGESDQQHQQPRLQG
ncbi:hypothetical protein, conserved [Eimeria tenella]|uniref:Transcription factor IIIC subunit 5 HTH domain-containing protein n=1 Tax=Eimeria tenella TaxID=5802 RepID=U6L4G2_EIMTE|nr:hypothetical protein, conserved [Eimeria tenella]CDJ42665.1 hypothetical protein, conserved [Eimeria tenella]|eukprot:XP_013233415.1 hypothetical protein, conserved [Eimeria tenella]